MPRSRCFAAVGGVALCVVLVVLGLVGMVPGMVAAARAQAITRPGPAYWLIGGDGGVFPYGRGAYAGGLANRTTNAPVVGGAVRPSGLGYWLAAADGGVFAFGDARWYGSVPSTGGHATIVAMAAAPDGAGYWLTGQDGSVYAFGSARYLGGVAGRALSAPVVGMAAAPDGRGYWLAGADGAVYAFGDAPYSGGLTRVGLNAPISAMAATATGRGYWLAGADGGVYAFGDAVYAGGLSGRPHARIVGIARVPQGSGYWLVGADGGVFGIGGAGYFGSVGASRLNQGVVAILSGDGVAIPQTPSAPDSSAGFDVSWPQCNRLRPAPPYGFGVVGVTRGHLFSTNPCLREQWSWAQSYGSFAAAYVNSNAPTAIEFAAAALRDARMCALDAGCILDRWGRAGADQALRAARGVPAPMWWLDVETANTWLPDPAANAVIIRAMVDELQRAGKRVGIYSTPYQWGVIAGTYAPRLPVWVPGAPAGDAAAYCAGHGFGGGPTFMAQSGDGTFDTDVLCAAGMAAYRTGFAPPAPVAVPEYPGPSRAAVAPPHVVAPVPAVESPARLLPASPVGSVSVPANAAVVAPVASARTGLAGPAIVAGTARPHHDAIEWAAVAAVVALLIVGAGCVAGVRTLWQPDPPLPWL